MSHKFLLIRLAREMVKRNVEIVKELKAKYQWLDEIDHVFVQQGPHTSLIGKPLTQVTHLSWRKALQKAGLPAGIRFHDCRHRFAT